MQQVVRLVVRLAFQAASFDPNESYGIVRRQTTSYPKWMLTSSGKSTTRRSSRLGVPFGSFRPITLNQLQWQIKKNSSVVSRCISRSFRAEEKVYQHNPVEQWGRSLWDHELPRKLCHLGCVSLVGQPFIDSSHELRSFFRHSNSWVDNYWVNDPFSTAIILT